ncbi:drug/metabolite transporter (DMT)-like permease [Prolixibacter denitrificans]|uniref:Drug/metabolite transporter (DMT)-like permease n=1 Tax=Prolixibacter denitrificans TaxID=1541063 RepID=A0A2P8CK22_9BACT|nr:drug/metabolite transporter (DMT)-like permease [Prolixibacter denitrificans]GET19940.1 membrane protein [Prolixibacter denitrificans]
MDTFAVQNARTVKNKISVYLAVTMAMAFWAISFVWVKIVYQAYGPLTTVFFRLVIATILLFAYTKLTGRLMKPARKDWKAFILLAFFEPFLYFMGESFSLKYASSTVAAVIVATIPLFSPLAASRFHGEKVSPRTILGIILSFVGVTVVVLDTSENLSASILGITLEFVAVAATVGYTVVLKGLTKKYNTTSIVAYQSFIGIFYFLPFWMTFEMNSFIHTPVNVDSLIAILKLAIFASGFAFLFFTYSVGKLGINKANIFMNSIPVFTAIFAWLILGETLSLQKLTGISIVIAGLFLAQMRIRKKALNNTQDEVHRSEREERPGTISAQ